MHTIKKQTGASALGNLTLVLLLVFGAITVMKLWSPYFEDMAIKSALDGVAKDSASGSLGAKDLVVSIKNRLDVNEVNLDPKFIHIKKDNGLITIDIKYERRIHMYANIDAVLSFEHTATINARSS